MGTDGSIRRTALPGTLAVGLMVAGWLAMIGTQLVVGRFGVRSALVLSELALVAPALLIALLAAVSVREGLGFRPSTRRISILALVSGVAFWVWSLGLLEVQYAVWKPPPGYLEQFQRLLEILRPANPLDWLASVGAIALAPALFEEILFRGIVLPALLRRLGAVAAVVASAALFGAIHLDPSYVVLGLMGHDPGMTVGSLYRVPFAFAVGLGLGALRLRAGSLWPSILAHALLNTITFVVEPLVESPSATADPNLALGAALLLSGLAGSILVLRVVDSGHAS